MREKSVVLILCAIALVCAGNVDFWLAKTVRGASTIIVPDDYSTIQGAVNNANDGDTISVKTGSYYGCIVLNKSLNLIGEDRETAIIDGNGTGNVVTINANSVNITGFTVQDSGSTAGAVGILLDGAGLCNVSGNNIRDNFDSGISLEWSSSNLIAANSIVTNDVVTNLEGGIAVVYSHNNTVTGNYVALHGIVGIAVAWSHDNTLSWNNVTQIAGSPDFHGINLWRSERNRISQNRVWASKGYGIRIEGQSDNNTLSDNSVENCSTGLQVIDHSNYNTLSGNVITGAEYGIRIRDYARYTHVVDNAIVNNRASNDSWSAGIRLDSGWDSEIRLNVISGNWYGILVYTASPRVFVISNSITGNEFGLRMDSGGSDYLNVSDNIVMSNRGYGIGLTGFGGASNYATIARNLIVNNTLEAVGIGQGSNYNTIVQNTMSENGYGLYIASSTQNTIFNNNIISNSQQVHVDSGSVNAWNGSYPSGGNYWSDYGGADQFGGLFQNVTGSDGIGDTAYTIDTYNVDHFPLMVPYNPSPIGGDLNADGAVDIFDIVIVALEFGHPPPPIVDTRADVNKDGVVDIFDIAIVAIHFGESAAGRWCL